MIGTAGSCRGSAVGVQSVSARHVSDASKESQHHGVGPL